MSPSPPRGITRSIRPVRPTRTFVSSRPRGGTICTASSGPAGERLAHQRAERLVGARGLLSAAQQHRVAALEAERRGVHGDVGARLVDHGDHAEGDAHLTHGEPVGTPREAEHLAHRIVHRDDLAHRLGDGVEALAIEREAIEQRVAEARFAAAREVFFVRAQHGLTKARQRARRRGQPLGDGLQARVFGLATKRSERAARFFRT
jgi:hypothetical protein